LIFIGLQLTLNIDVDEYVPDLSDASGVRLLIHDPYIIPFVDTDGLSLSTGKDFSISVKKVNLFA
jgi:hypothetical protein